jgi:RNA polymerase sigma-70 factor (ECF subfamily)
MKTYTDEQLVANYLNPVRSPHHRCGSCLRQLTSNGVKGDEKSLEILIHRYLKPIYSFVYRYIGNEQETEDITQEVFVKTWLNLKKFDRNRSFKTWIFSIAKNASLDFLKKKKAILFSEFEKEDGGNVIIDSLADPSPLPQEILEKSDMAKILNVALEKLPPSYRMVLFLHYNDHFTFREIAEIFGEPLNTIKSRHRRAILILRKMLKVEDK